MLSCDSMGLIIYLGIVSHKSNLDQSKAHNLPELINYYLFQVFFTSEGKGWGLRTLDDLPKGAFVCEYVGEIVTNTELYERNLQSTGKERHTYPVLLDADWGSEGVLKDEEALCLDATSYGNVARFINHRYFFNIHLCV